MSDDIPRERVQDLYGKYVAALPSFTTMETRDKAIGIAGAIVVLGLLLGLPDEEVETAIVMTFEVDEVTR